MRNLQTINMWEITEGLKWTAFKRLNLLFIAPFRYDKPKVRKQIEADLKIAKAENAELDSFIRQFALRAEHEAIVNIPF